MGCPDCKKTHFTVSKIRRAFIDPSLVADGPSDKRKLDLSWVARETGLQLERGPDGSRDGFYFFLDCRYLNFEGKCPYGPDTVKGIQASTHIATVHEGLVVSVAVCNQDLRRTDFEPVAPFARTPMHLVKFEDFLAAYDHLAPGEFTPQCIDHLMGLWPAT